MKRKLKTPETDFRRQELLIPSCVKEWLKAMTVKLCKEMEMEITNSDVVSFLVAERSAEVRKHLEEAGYVFPTD